MKKIILASASPRRSELLHQLGWEFEVIPSDADESGITGKPGNRVVALSKLKAGDVWRSLENRQKDIILIAADTVVAFEEEVLGKPADEEEAKEMLRKLSGKEHQVYTGVTFMWKNDMGFTQEYSFFVETGVLMYRISEAEIDAYVATGEPMDKAGAYGIQGKAGAFVKMVRGEYANVVGLPIARLYHEMKAWDLLD